MITFLYKQRPDNTFVIEHKLGPYHVILGDPLYAQCVEEYAALDAEPPDEPPPQEVTILADPLQELRDRIAKLEARLV